MRLSGDVAATGQSPQQVQHSPRGAASARACLVASVERAADHATNDGAGCRPRCPVAAVGDLVADDRADERTADGCTTAVVPAVVSRGGRVVRGFRVVVRRCWRVVDRSWRVVHGPRSVVRTYVSALVVPVTVAVP